MRPGYGYAGVEDPFIDRKAPEETGIRRLDLQAGESELIVSLAELAAIPRDGRRVAIDSPHGGNGRQVYLLDASRIIG